MRDQLLTQGYQPSSVRAAFAILGKVYEWARRKRVLLVENPVFEFEKPRIAPTDLEFLSRREVSVLLAHAEEHVPELHPMIATALYTGMRKGELFGLRWRDVHLDMARIQVLRSYKLARKSGKARHLPMHPDLVRILREWEARCPRIKEGLVFPVDGEMGKTTDMLGLPRS